MYMYSIYHVHACTCMIQPSYRYMCMHSTHIHVHVLHVTSSNLHFDIPSLNVHCYKQIHPFCTQVYTHITHILSPAVTCFLHVHVHLYMYTCEHMCSPLVGSWAPGFIRMPRIMCPCTCTCICTWYRHTQMYTINVHTHKYTRTCTHMDMDMD